MKAKSTIMIASLALAFLLIVGTTSAQAQCCYGDVLAAPFVAAGAVVYGAAVVTAAVVTAPFTALSCCGTCGVATCNPCNFSYAPSLCDHC